MAINHVPKISKDNLTGCCQRFNPKGWDGEIFEFKDKPFVRVITYSIFYMPLNMSSVMAKTQQILRSVGAEAKDEYLMLSYDISPWKCEHLISVTKDVPGLENIKISGKFMSKVFEGPFKDAPKWMESMRKYVKSKGELAEKIYFYYTTCPNCSKSYGKNYVVAMAKV